MNEIEKAKAAKEFDEVLLERRPFSEFCILFDRYGKDCPRIFLQMIAYDMMLNADFLTRCNKAHLYAIYMSMPSMCNSGRIATRIFLDKTIPLETRGLFWSKIQYHKLNETATEKLFLDDINLINTSRAGAIVNRSNRDNLNAAIRSDSISSFELNRRLLGIEIRKSLIEYLLMRNAANIFLYLFDKYPRKFYAIRPKENWLFFILNNMKNHHLSENTALHLLTEIEKKEPGIVARIRDPWGNTLLWYTSERTNTIKKMLIDCGCRPEIKNIFGLSIKLLEENNIDSYEKEFVSRYGEPFERRH